MDRRSKSSLRFCCYELPDIKSDTIVTAIKDSLIRMKLSLNDLRAQAYDGASNMFGKNPGVFPQFVEMRTKRQGVTISR